MNEIFWIIGATLVVSAASLLGIFTLCLKEKILNKILMVLVSLSAGALMGGAFLHLIPEAVEISDPSMVFPSILLGFVAFFIIEKALHWRHCHKGHCEIHTFAYMNLVGDSVHNFIDGMIIAASFMADFNLGIATTFAVLLHEVPQEIGDFGVLVYGKFSKAKALAMNFLTALTAVAGGIIGYYLSGYSSSLSMLLLPFAAGGFIYIAASDLLPEIRKEKEIRKSALNLLVFLAGIVLMFILTVLE